MKRVIAALAVVPVLVALAGCGTGSPGSSTPEAKVKVGGLGSDVAVKLGNETITTADLDRLIEQQRAQAKAQGQDFPEASSKAFPGVKKQLLNQLVIQRVYDLEAKKCGKPCEVADKEIDARIDEIVKSNYAGNRAKFDTFLADSKYTLAEARNILRINLELPKLYAHVTDSVKFTEKDAKKYYEDNKAQFQVRAGRRVSHILFDASDKALALKVRGEANDSNFSALAAKYSKDSGSKDQGGDVGLIQKGTFVPEFEKAAYALKDGEISQPVKTQFGWHVIRVKDQPASTTAFAEVKDQIITSQGQTAKQEAFKKWQQSTLADWNKRSTYASIDLVPEEQLNPKTTSTSTGSGTAPAATDTETSSTGPATP